MLTLESLARLSRGPMLAERKFKAVISLGCPGCSCDLVVLASEVGLGSCHHVHQGGEFPYLRSTLWSPPGHVPLHFLRISS